MRTLLLGLLIAWFVSATTTTARADPLPPPVVLRLKNEARKGKIMAGTGGTVLGLSLGMAVACALFTAGDLLTGPSQPGTAPNHTLRDAMIATCTVHAALVTIGIPLTIAGAHEITQSRVQLRLGLTGVSGTF